MSEPEAMSQARRYLAVAMLGGVYTLSFLDRQLLSILAEPVKVELGLSDTQLGLLTGFMFALFYTLFGVPVAWLADRSHRVRIVAAACALWSLFSAGCGLAQNFGQLALARMGVGVGEAGGSPPSYAIIADYFPPEQRGRALALYSLGIPLGTTAGAAIGGWIASAHGWRAAFIAIGLFGVLFALLVLVAVPEPRRGRFDTVQATRTSLGAALRLFVGDRTLRWASLAGGLSAFVGYSMLSWTPALLMRVHGMTLGELTLYYSMASGGAITVGTLLSGQLVDHLGRADRRMYALVPAAAFVVALPVYFAAIAADGWQAALLLIAVPFALYSMYLAPVLAVVQNAVPAGCRSTASAVLLLIVNLIGLGLGPVYIGWVSDATAAAGEAEPLRLAMFALAPMFLLAALAHIAVARSLGSMPIFNPARK